MSHRRLARRVTLPRALGPWALDSGGFTELRLHGRWTVTLRAYAQAIRRYRDEIGGLQWAAPQDWMVESEILAKTGRTVAEHQQRTLANYLELRSFAPELPIIPVLQGWRLGDYLRHVDAYTAAGVDLRAAPLVGVGSVCRRQGTTEATTILATLAGLGLRCHAFGYKTDGLRRAALLLASADSLAWSATALRQQIRLPSCTHADCRNCARYAMQWRDTVCTAIDQCRPAQLRMGLA